MLEALALGHQPVAELRAAVVAAPEDNLETQRPTLPHVYVSIAVRLYENVVGHVDGDRLRERRIEADACSRPSVSFPKP
jgi:hypothetical protein